MNSARKEMDMTQGPFLKKIILFAIPLVLTGVLQQLYNAADLIVVGHFDGQIPLAAVGSTGALTNLVVGLFMGLSVGAGVSVAHHIGAKEYRDVSDVVHTSLLVSVILGVVISVFGILFAPDFLRMMDTPENVINDSILYIRIIFLGMPASMLYNYAASMVRSTGDAKHPLIFLATSGLINVALNLVLVAGFHLGVAGVASATIVSQYASAVMILIFMHRADTCVRFSFRSLKVHFQKLKKILYIGIPSGIQGALFSFSNVLIQSSINGFGDTVMAGSTASSNLEGFVYIAMNAIYHVSLTFVGQNIGAKTYQNIKKIMVYCVAVVCFIGLASGAAILLFRNFLVGLYAPDNPAVLAEALKRMYIILPTYFLCGVMDVLCGGLRAMGKSVTAMVISLAGACGLRILWIHFIFPFFAVPEGVYWSYPVSWLITLLCHLIFLVIFTRMLIRGASEESETGAAREKKSRKIGSKAEKPI